MYNVKEYIVSNLNSLHSIHRLHLLMEIHHAVRTEVL